MTHPDPQPAPITAADVTNLEKRVLGSLLIWAVADAVVSEDVAKALMGYVEHKDAA